MITQSEFNSLYIDDQLDDSIIINQINDKIEHIIEFAFDFSFFDIGNGFIPNKQTINTISITISVANFDLHDDENHFRCIFPTKWLFMTDNERGQDQNTNVNDWFVYRII